MPTRELTHLDIPKFIMSPAAASNANTAALDISLPFVNQPSSGYIGGAGNTYAEAAAIVFALGLPSSLTAAITLTLTPQEADASGGPWTNVDPMYVEWFQDGIPGGPTGSGGTAAWAAQIPGNIPQTYPAALLLNGAPLEQHIYSFSYVGGQHRFIRLNMAIAGAVTNVVSAVGHLGALLETYGRLYSNWNPLTGGIG